MCERISDELLKVLIASEPLFEQSLQMDLLLDDAANIFADFAQCIARCAST